MRHESAKLSRVGSGGKVRVKFLREIPQFSAPSARRKPAGVISFQPQQQKATCMMRLKLSKSRTGQNEGKSLQSRRGERYGGVDTVSWHNAAEQSHHMICDRAALSLVTRDLTDQVRLKR